MKKSKFMKKIGKHSHFAVVGGNELASLGDKILQIDTKKQYVNQKNYGVYICEISDEEADDE